MMTLEKIIQTIKKMDLLIRPYIVFLHPDDAEAIRVAEPKIEDKIVIQATPFVEKGKGLIVKREEYESWAGPHLADDLDKVIYTPMF